MSIELTLRHRLAEAGGWVDAADLRAGLGFSEAMVDDVLSDLVIHGMALFNARTLQYRLAVGPAARRAVQRLVRDDSQHKAVIAAPAGEGGGYLIGLAKRIGGQLLCAEVALDAGAHEVNEAIAPMVARWMEGTTHGQ